MTTDYRALCAELLNGLDELVHPRYPFPGYTRCAMDRARALLAEPEAEGPSEEELYDLADEFNGDPVPAMRAALARWGRPTPQPKPERVPHWSEGICGDGAAILRDGVMIPIEEVIAELNRRPTPEATND